MWKCQKPSSCLLLQTSDQSIDQHIIQALSEVHFPLNPLRHNSRFDRFPSHHLVPKLIATLILSSSYFKWIPLPHIPLHFSSIHNSAWQIYDTTLYHQASPSLCLCQVDRNVDAFACSNKSSSSVWLLNNMISLHLFPQHIYFIWYFWVTGVMELHEKSKWLMSGQILNTNTQIILVKSTSSFHSSWEFQIICTLVVVTAIVKRILEIPGYFYSVTHSEYRKVRKQVWIQVIDKEILFK